MAKGFVLCADDFAMTAGISRSVLRLAERGRLSATSVMAGFPHWASLAREIAGFAGRIDIGLHLNLTLGKPMTAMPSLTEGGALPPIKTLALRSLTGRLSRAELAAEIDAQLDAFEERLQRPPDHVDGHQHAHALPIIRSVLVERIVQRYPGDKPSLRNPADRLVAVLRRGRHAAKAAALMALAAGTRRLAAERGIAMNEGFSGYSAFDPNADYAADFATYLVAPGPKHLVMCHPGEVDDELRGLDPAVESRSLEEAFLMSDRFDELCDAAGMMPRRFAAV